MDSIVRKLKIQELTARLFLYDLEILAMRRELSNQSTTTERRAMIYIRQPQLSIERINAENDLKWLQAEERLGRPDTFHTISA